MMEVENLFESLTVKEIKQQNIKTRTEIERKKEELRFLVSERYRDIIDAADTIFEMKTCATEINDSIKKINNIYKDWNSLTLHKSVINQLPVGKDAEIKQIKLSFASQIKLILNMSELIWNALETKQFNKASMLFNICRNMSIHSQLVSDKYKVEELDIGLVFNRHWSSLRNLESTIGLVCRNYLRSPKSKHTTDLVLDSLLAIIILEDQDVNFVLEEYLNNVEYQIQEWFSPKNSCVPINLQLESVAGIIMDAISIVYQLFFDNTLINRLNELSNLRVKEMDCTQEEIIYRHLPDGIALFKPALKSYQHNSQFMDKESIVTITTKWLKCCRDKYSSSFISSFKFLPTVKSIGDVRADLEKIFLRINNKSLDNKEWKQLENENMTEWKIIIKNMYSIKLKDIIDENISIYFSNWCQSIEKFLETNINLLNEDEFDGDSFFNYFWTEFNKDVFFHAESSQSTNYVTETSASVCKKVFESLNYHFLNFFDVGSSSSNKSCSFESLVVKYKVVRPEIYQITRNLNNQLVQLINEFINSIIDNEDFLWAILTDCLSSIVNRCIEWSKKFVSTNKSESVQPIELLRNDKLFYDFKNDADNALTPYQLKMIIISQSIRTIYELLPSFQAGLMTSVFNSENIKSPNLENKTISKKKWKNSRLPFLPGKRINHQQDMESAMWNKWNDTIDPLKNIVNQFVVNGTQSSISNYISGYFRFVKYGFKSVESCEEISTKWVTINLNNNELNNGICLEVPIQCSWPMHILLLNISHLLSIFGAHAITGKCSDGIRQQILNIMIDNYSVIKETEEFQENKLSQKQNIQLIFDIRFLLEIINAKTGIEKDIQDNLRSLLNEIEQRVDPFDYEMMSEALHQNLQQNISKNLSLYWLLSSSQPKKNISFGQKLDVGTSQHNLIDLVGTSSGKTTKSNLRFTMLPVSGYTLMDKNSISNSLKESPKLEPKIEKVSPTILIQNKPTNVRKVNNYVQNSNKSYFGRLGSNWF